MQDVHVYNKAVDGLYDFEQMTYFLTDEQIEKAALAVTGQTSIVVIESIRFTETLKRDCCLGRLTDAECTRQCSIAENNVKSKIGVWSYQTEAYRQFYSAL